MNFNIAFFNGKLEEKSIKQLQNMFKKMEEEKV